MRKLIFTSIVALMAGGVAKADVAEDLRELIEAGEYSRAVKAGRDAIADAANASQLGQLNELTAEALWNLRGNTAEARSYFEEAKKRGVADASLYLGRIAMLDYDFPAAQAHYGEYKRLKQRAKKPLADDFEYEEAGLEEGKTQFGRVREIVVIDAVEVARRDFFKQMRLPLSAGRLVAVSTLPLPDGKERGEVAFTSESGDTMMWSEVNDSTGMLQLAEAARLADGTLSPTRLAPEFLGQNGDAEYPFLSADGTTLYYAADGDNSIGGYDIFIATRDPQTGDYLQPVNAGIPFNSAADDYMMAIDEENGVGWWATDRNMLPDDRITLYVYLLPEERKNVEGSDEEKRSRSTLRDIRKTWIPSESLDEDDEDGEDEDEDASAPKEAQDIPSAEELARQYQAKAAEIRAIKPGQKPKNTGGPRIPLPGGGYVYSPDDVKTPEQKMLVEQYFESEKAYAANKARLAKLRRQYAENPNPGLGSEIKALEVSTQRESAALTNQLSQFYRFMRKR